ncbi:protein DEHYDRATION-INDUCED 19 homolog 4-like isoform X2 [Nicotiana tomentosiformis]|uniref:protein DEHYDRATION-INDUCED 19 homolog 4-like isoform X2 n=1 Tax=Nicotiana tomentosiformis TaxID=4098 RepID=UPI000877EF12|nr:protein DEHYDRATION-INDUCED 19 homolog 4-like isoform X2 [Nicotiana tomentosiformis]
MRVKRSQGRSFYALSVARILILLAFAVISTTSMLLRLRMGHKFFLFFCNGGVPANLRASRLIHRICPVCAKKVGVNLVGHITQQHGNILKVQRKRRFRRGGSNSTLSILRKELREGSLQSILRGSSHLISSSTTDPDPLLSSFINSSALVDEPPEVQPLSSAKACSTQDSAVENLSDRNFQPSPLSEEDQEEKARKSKFVQGLLLSTFLEDDF